MSRDRTRLRDPDLGYRTIVMVAGAMAGLLVVVWAAARLTGNPRVVNNPLAYVLGLMLGNYPWPPGATVLLVVLACALLVLLALGVAVYQRYGAIRRAIDLRGRYMARAGDLRLYTQRGLEEAARKLHTTHVGLCVPIGNLVHGKQPLGSNYEMVLVCIMGPRSGKTSCLAVRQIMRHRGPVVATSNKRDIVDLTRGPRAVHGDVRVFDPQGIIGEQPTWWWNPLSYITAVPPAQQWGRAAELAGVVIAAGRTADNARTDAYFDNEAAALLATVLLAAAVADYPITECYTWLSNPRDTTAETLLMEHDATDLGLAGRAVKDIMQLTPRQRDGVLGMCRSYLSWLRDPAVLPWITRTSVNDNRPQFDPQTLISGQHTLYLISREGAGTARALTAALTVAVARTAEASASRSDSGRLPTPLLLDLDEAANVCKWPDLPDLYSHFGSKGIIPIVFLQSWAQALETWGPRGAEKLWSAANVRIVGAGQADPEFLDRVSKLVGDHDVHRRNTTHGRGQRTIATAKQRERILEVSDLARMPNDRAVVLPSGAPAALMELVHYSAEPYAADVRDSEAVYAPKNHHQATPAGSGRPR